MSPRSTRREYTTLEQYSHIKSLMQIILFSRCQRNPDQEEHNQVGVDEDLVRELKSYSTTVEFLHNETHNSAAVCYRHEAKYVTSRFRRK